MPPFARALSAAYVGREPARPLAAEALGAVMLDASGLKPDEIEHGRVVVIAEHANGDDQASCVEAALRRIYKGRINYADELARLKATDVPLDGRILLTDAMHAMKPDWWMTTVGELSLGCVIVVSDTMEIHGDVEAWKTRTVTVPDTDTWPIIADAIRLATGGQFVLREIECRGATVSDVRSSLGVKNTAKETVDTLRKIVSGRKAKKLRAEAKAADDDGIIGLDAEPLSARIERVIRRLSEMTGFGEAAVWGMRLAEDVRDYKEGRMSWLDLDKGALLVGPPGSGKTTFARALAAECGIELVVTTYGDWNGTGSGDSRSKGLRKLFDEWRTRGADGPILLFVDEIDSMGARGLNGNNESWFVTIINAWLAFLDGAIPRPGVIVLAATNHLSRVDPAMLRPGRLDRVIDLPYPGVEALAGIIRHHLGSDAVIDDAELRAASKACRGRSPAAIEQLCREAKSLCRRIYKRRVCAEDVTDVVRVQRMMTARPADLDTSVAVHEASHAVVALALGHGVVSADVDVGQVRLAPNRPLHDEAGILADMTIGLAGKAGEEVVLGQRSTSGGADVEQVTASALMLHARVGLGIAGHVRIDAANLDMRDTLYDAVRTTTDAAWDRALGLVRLHRANVERVAAALQRDRYLDGAEVAALIVHPLRDLARRPAPDEPEVPEWVPSPPRRGHGWGPRLAA